MTAYELGVQAFKNGKRAIPIQDPKLMKLIKEDKKNEVIGHSIPYLQAWSKGWHSHNIATPIKVKRELFSMV